MKLIKEIFSLNRKQKAEIIQRDDGLFEVDIYEWDNEWKTWLQKGTGLSITDIESRAMDIALEKLHECYDI